MSTLFEITLDYVRESGVEALVDIENQSIGLNYKGDYGTWSCIFRIREDERQLVFYSIHPDNVPIERYPMMMEFITRANYGMITGNFEMDLRDGEIRFKTVVDLGEATLTHDLIKPIVIKNLSMMECYIQGIRAVSEGVEPELGRWDILPLMCLV